MIGYPPSAIVQTSYLFVDANNVLKELEKFSQIYLGGAEFPILWGRLKQEHRKVFFYDAIPVQLPGEDDNTYNSRVAPKREAIAEIDRIPGFHVRIGDARKRKRSGLQQKMVDVHLAVDALLMASRGLFSSVTLMIGDLDFKPLVSALVEMGVDVTLIYPIGATSDELIAAADNAIPLTHQTIAGWLDQSRSGFCHVSVGFGGGWAALMAGRSLIHTWDNDGYGTCRAFLESDGRWGVVSERTPDQHQSLCFQAHSKDIETLRIWLAQNYDLIIPRWQTAE